MLTHTMDLKFSVLFFFKHAFIYEQKQLKLRYINNLFIIIVGNLRLDSSTTYQIKSRRNKQWVCKDGLVYKYLL